MTNNYHITIRLNETNKVKIKVFRMKMNNKFCFSFLRLRTTLMQLTSLVR